MHISLDSYKIDKNIMGADVSVRRSVLNHSFILCMPSYIAEIVCHHDFVIEKYLKFYFKLNLKKYSVFFLNNVVKFYFNLLFFT